MDLENSPINNNKIIKAPVIVTDLDGVILERQTPLPKARETIQFLQNKPEIPFLYMTNRSGISEKDMSLHLNNGFKFENENELEFIQGEQVIMSHSAMKETAKQFNDSPVLIIGREKEESDIKQFHDFLKYMGFNKYMTGREYSMVYPFLTPLIQKQYENKEEKIKQICERFGISVEELQKKPMQMHAIFILTIPLDWEDNTQIVLDLLSTENGEIAEKFDTDIPQNRKHIPVFATLNDNTYKDKMALPRMIMGGFTISLKTIYEKLYGQQLEIKFFGKPEKVIFEHVSKYVESPKFLEFQIKRLSVKFPEITQNNTSFVFGSKYMIGDNPESDISGANKTEGWKSVLVRTGVFRGEDNDKEFPADYVVDDIKEAIKLICKLEGFECDLQ